MTRVYCDHNATAPLRPAARAAMIAAMDLVGNPSSVHGEGRAARRIIDEARRTIAAAFGDERLAVTFTSGASEAAATLLTPSLQRPGPGLQGSALSLVVLATEHPCILTGGRFSRDDMAVVPVTANGEIDLAALEAALASRPGPVLVAIQSANSETGVLQPLDEVSAIVRAHGGLLVVDAVQSFGRVPYDGLLDLADAVFVSGHKIGGPKGIGAIIHAADRVRFDPLIAGGGQERGARAGTENVAAVAGLAAAVDDATQDVAGEAIRLARLRDRFEAELMAIAPDAEVFGAQSRRLPNTSCFAIPGMTAEIALIAYDIEGVALSSGSACSSGKVKSSHVLAAMGVAPDLIRCGLRVSLGWSSTPDCVERLIGATRTVVQRLKRPGRAAA